MSKRSRRRYPRTKKWLRRGLVLAEVALAFVPMGRQARMTAVGAIRGVKIMQKNRKGDR